MTDTKIEEILFTYSSHGRTQIIVDIINRAAKTEALSFLKWVRDNQFVVGYKQEENDEFTDFWYQVTSHDQEEELMDNEVYDRFIASTKEKIK